jgi:hypothetical protein
MRSSASSPSSRGVERHNDLCVRPTGRTPFSSAVRVPGVLATTSTSSQPIGWRGAGTKRSSNRHLRSRGGTGSCKTQIDAIHIPRNVRNPRSRDGYLHGSIGPSSSHRLHLRASDASAGSSKGARTPREHIGSPCSSATRLGQRQSQPAQPFMPIFELLGSTLTSISLNKNVDL